VPDASDSHRRGPGSYGHHPGGCESVLRRTQGRLALRAGQRFDPETCRRLRRSAAPGWSITRVRPRPDQQLAFRPAQSARSL
jgi:hypothetical protein